MKEYIILRDTDNKITKALNKWRHEFHIEIISVLMDNRVMDEDLWLEKKDVKDQKFVLLKERLEDVCVRNLYPRPWGTLVVFLTRERKEEGWENVMRIEKKNYRYGQMILDERKSTISNAYNTRT